MKNKKKVVFVYFSSHRIHETWMNCVNAEFFSFIPKIFTKKSTKVYRTQVFDNFVFNHPFIHQTLAFINSLFLPKADVYVCEGISTMMGPILKKGKNSKIILINSDPLFYNFGKMNFLMKKIYSFYLKKIDGIISTSKLVNDKALKHLKVPSIIVHPFVEEKFFNLNLNKKSKILATIAGDKNKGVDDLIDIFLNSTFLSEFLIISPVYDKELESKIKLNKCNGVIAVGWTNVPQNYLKKAGFYINLSRFESFGINILEAMAAGIPPIVSNMCGAKEIVKKVSKRLIVKNKQEAEKVFLWLYKNPSIKIDLSKKSKKIARKYVKKESIKEFKKLFFEFVHID